MIGYSIDGDLTTTATGHLGSTELTNNGDPIDPVARQTYLPYGGIRNGTTSGLTTDHTYTGQVDDGIGWMHYRARQYDPTLARFLQADTITVDGLNRYTYFENKPMILIDPTGLEGG
ncbi:MAG: RHS repeat-associated core domain-containing protein, partial [Actinomycetia bacterium]|nr:RHS repeat-associated core domain-containing protein [Actinomycetes bacterium]